MCCSECCECDREHVDDVKSKVRQRNDGTLYILADVAAEDIAFEFERRFNVPRQLALDVLYDVLDSPARTENLVRNLKNELVENPVKNLSKTL